MALLELKNLHVALEDGTEIVKGVDLSVDSNQVHAIMGPNGSGKSTLAYALMGHPAYVITQGQILFDGEDVTELAADERAQRGLFLAFQYPHAIPGVTVTNFLRQAINSLRKARAGGREDPIAVKEFRTELLAAMERLRVPRELAILLVVVLLVFGPKRLPEMGKSLGKGMREFKDSISGKEKEESSELPAAAHASPQEHVSAASRERDTV